MWGKTSTICKYVCLDDDDDDGDEQPNKVPHLCDADPTAHLLKLHVSWHIQPNPSNLLFTLVSLLLLSSTKVVVSVTSTLT